METGLVVAPSDPEALRTALDTFWEHPEKVEKWGLAALARYQETFRAEMMAEKYYEIYESVLR